MLVSPRGSMDQQTPTYLPAAPPLMHHKLKALHLRMQRFILLFRGVQHMTLIPCWREKKKHLTQYAEGSFYLQQLMFSVALYALS